MRYVTWGTVVISGSDKILAVRPRRTNSHIAVRYFISRNELVCNKNYVLNHLHHGKMKVLSRRREFLAQ